MIILRLDKFITAQNYEGLDSEVSTAVNTLYDLVRSWFNADRKFVVDAFCASVLAAEKLKSHEKYPA